MNTEIIASLLMPWMASITILCMGILVIAKDSPKQPEWKTMSTWSRFKWCWHFWLISGGFFIFGASYVL